MTAQIICMELPLRIISEANSRDHWCISSKRKKLHRTTARVMLQQHLRPMSPSAVEVTLTRCGPRKLDDDNLASGFKAVRDGVADWLGIDDGDERMTWRYQQRKSKAYAAEVAISWAWP